MFKTRLATWLLILSIFAIGCSDSGDDDDGPAGPGGGAPPAAMVGTWTYQSVTINGSAASLSAVLDWVSGAVAARINVQSNSAYVYEEVASNGGQLWFESGFVFIDGNEMDVNAQLDSDGQLNETRRFSFTLSGDTITLSQVVQGDTYVFTLTK